MCPDNYREGVNVIVFATSKPFPTQGACHYERKQAAKQSAEVRNLPEFTVVF